MEGAAASWRCVESNCNPGSPTTDPPKPKLWLWLWLCTLSWSPCSSWAAKTGGPGSTVGGSSTGECSAGSACIPAGGCHGTAPKLAGMAGWKGSTVGGRPGFTVWGTPKGSTVGGIGMELAAAECMTESL